MRAKVGHTSHCSFRRMRVMDLRQRLLAPSRAAVLRHFAPATLLSTAVAPVQINSRTHVQRSSKRLWIAPSSRPEAFSQASRSIRKFASAGDQNGGSQAGRKTVDEQEVSKFGAIGSGWWDLNGMQKPLHSFNALRATFLRNMANEQHKRRGDHLQGLKVLDVGCGGGILSEELCRMGGDVTGIDASPENIAVAEQHAGPLLTQKQNSGEGGKLQYRAQTTTQLLLEGGEGAYDVVVCSEVLEHVSDVEQMVGELCRLYQSSGVLKGAMRGQVTPSGILVISTINKTNLSYALGVVAAEQVLGLVPRGTIGAGYNPLLDKWFVTPDTSVNYLLYAARTA